MSDPVDPRPSYWAGQGGIAIIALLMLIIVKGVLSCGSM
jgi:hypothetical protein